MDLNMGKYALFVWGSYGVSFVAIVGLVALSLRTHLRHKTVLAALQAAADAPKSDVTKAET